MSPETDPFTITFTRRRRRRFVELAETFALSATVVALFAWATSLDILRHTALAAVLLPLPLLLLGLIWRVPQGDLDAALVRGTLATALAGIFVWLAFGLEGLGLGYERRITELPQAQVRTAAEIDARRHPEQETILEMLDTARADPGIATLRPLVPLLHLQEQYITDAEGRSRSVAEAVRGVLMADRDLLLRSLHEEALGMGALMPVDDLVPPVVEVDVAGRLRSALGLLLELHVEHRMQNRFELPRVGVVLDTVVPHPEHGARELRHEVGLTFPFDGFASGDDAPLDYATLRAVLDMVREDLNY